MYAYVLVAACRSLAPTHPSCLPPPLALPVVWPPLPAPVAHAALSRPASSAECPLCTWLCSILPLYWDSLLSAPRGVCCLYFIFTCCCCCCSRWHPAASLAHPTSQVSLSIRTARPDSQSAGCGASPFGAAPRGRSTASRRARSQVRGRADPYRMMTPPPTGQGRVSGRVQGLMDVHVWGWRALFFLRV